MTIRTPLCDMLGIKYPIMLAGMGGVSYGELAAAVSEAGGFGTLGMAGRSSEEIRREMKIVRDSTDKPFGVDLLAAVPESLERTADIIIEGGAKAFISGLGVPPPHLVKKFHDAGLKVMNVNGTVKHARSAERGGLDAVVAQGTEAGGHTGRIAGMALIPQIVDAVKIPVIAAGSIVDGRGLAASLALGAQGVWMGTRFIATPEARAVPGYKDALLSLGEDGTVITRGYTGKTCRVVRNDYTQYWESHTDELQPFPAQFIRSMNDGANHLGADEHTTDIDPDREFWPAGQGAGAMHELIPAGDLVRQIVAEAEEVLGRVATLT